MRIVSGDLKGRRFSPPLSFKARPTTDFAKENLFNVLSNRMDFESIRVLDLFGGTGSISYEFASRGCTDVTCVELNFNHYRFICKCVDELGLKKVIHPLKADVFKFLAKSAGASLSGYDLVFADPPFDMKEVDSLPALVHESGVLKPGGLLIFEHTDKKSFAMAPGFVEVRDYGKVNFSFFQFD
ncbi:MAG: RsmD family RNA methyltransferase [Marinilabiliaceae bacterium]|nr:RsmD family RNA methyltransferase [Marinilabiliaceae bacterium]